MTSQHCCYYLPRNIDFIVHDPVRDLGGEVEDGVLVWLDGLGGVDDKHQRRVERFVCPRVGALVRSRRLRTESTLAVAETSLVQTTEVVSIVSQGVTLAAGLQQGGTDTPL